MSRVLVVEDYPDAAMLCARWVKSLGHDVELAVDGYDALRRMAEFEPQCVLLDLGLPGMDGFEVAERIRANPHFASIWLIALTAFADPESRQRAERAGIDYYFTKPPGPHELSRAIGDCLLQDRTSAVASDPHFGAGDGAQEVPSAARRSGPEQRPTAHPWLPR